MQKRDEAENYGSRLIGMERTGFHRIGSGKDSGRKKIGLNCKIPL